MTDHKEILRLKNLGFSNNEVAIAVGCGRNTVTRTLQRAESAGISWHEAKGLSAEELRKRLFPGSKDHPQDRMPDYEKVHREMQKSGVTLSLLWVEYCEECRADGDLPYQSTQFNKYYAEYVHRTKATMHLDHKPGETLQVDWAGDTMGIVDTDTGESIPAYLFVSVLPYSGYAYAETFPDMKQESWITAHVNAYRFYGGVTRILTPDNLKTGVIKNTKDETVINRVYREMAEHYGTAVIPGRPRRPKDKVFVEGSVGVVSTWIIAALRNQRFFSLRELNGAVAEKLYEFNRKPFQKKEGSRASAFEEEKPFLKVEQQGYKACMALLKLTDKYSPQRIEDACRKALSYTPQPSYKIIQSILRSGQDMLPADEPKEDAKKPSQYSFTRGADYYRRDK